MSPAVLRAAPLVLILLLAAKPPGRPTGGWHPRRPPPKIAGVARLRAERAARLWVIAVAGQAVATAAEPGPGTVVLCRSAADCGDGLLGHGAVCDEAEPIQLGDDDGHDWGLCREACRDDRDCGPDAQCEDDLDPEDSDWSGCVPESGPDGDDPF